MEDGKRKAEDGDWRTETGGRKLKRCLVTTNS